MLLLSSVGWLFMVTCVGTVWSYEKSYEERRFAARYDACNDHAKFILNVKDDDGDCQVLCGPSSEPKLIRLKDKSVCRTANKNEPGLCIVGVCNPSSGLADSEQHPSTGRSTKAARTTVKFIPSTLPPITSGFTYSWQKWATSKPFTAAPVSTGSPRQSTLTTPLPGRQRSGNVEKTA